METRPVSCSEAADLFDLVVEGEADAAREHMLRSHIEACPACRARFALDLALIRTIKVSPDVSPVSVEAEVVERVKARQSRLSVVRWGGVVAAVSVAGLLIVWLGPAVFEYMAGLIAGGPAARPETAALFKVAGMLVAFLRTAGRQVAGSMLDTGAGEMGSYVAACMIMVGCVVLLMMYGLGRWLRKTVEVKS